jgi:hypothetical protein
VFISSATFAGTIKSAVVGPTAGAASTRKSIRAGGLPSCPETTPAIETAIPKTNHVRFIAHSIF